MKMVPSVIAVVRTMDNTILMLKRVDTDRSYPGKWCFPGGRIDDGERAEQAVLRELQEETGIVESDMIDFYLMGQEESPLPVRDIIYQISIFSVLVSDNVKIILSLEEHSEFKLLTPEEAISLDVAGPISENIIRSMLSGS
jgi:mutator protein MutT